jgi:hypothetical protein
MPASSLVTSLRALLGITQVSNRFLDVHVERQTRKSSPEASSTLHVISLARPLSPGLMVLGRFCFCRLGNSSAQAREAEHSYEAQEQRDGVGFELMGQQNT